MKQLINLSENGALVFSGLVFLTLTIFPSTPLLLATLTLYPYEAINRKRITREAKKILEQNPNLVVIGITGSYGKTTVKTILDTILSAKYSVLSTPKSYNTLFGIAKIIKENLNRKHEIFIVEMGAYKIGEIREICQMVKPRIGITTGITSQHLERFGSLDNIVKAKNELTKSLPLNGLAVFNLDSKPCRELYSKTNIPKIGYGIESPTDVNATDIKTGNKENIFSVKLAGDYQLDNLSIKLLGEHQILNTLPAVAVALHLNISEKEIKNALTKLEQPEHRLSLIQGANNSLIIDDAYSSNTEGYKAAFKLVEGYKDNPKIIVTPGLVELGTIAKIENRIMGGEITKVFDTAIIVNKTNRQALLEGIKNGGWSISEPKVYTSDSLEHVTKFILPKISIPNSIILFENDLPDIYD